MLLLGPRAAAAHPVRAPWADATGTLWTCHHIRAVSHANGCPYLPRVAIPYFFTSHVNIHHVRVFGYHDIPLVFRPKNGASCGCISVSRPSGKSIEPTAHSIGIEERHERAFVLPSPEWASCKRNFPGCSDCTVARAFRSDALRRRRDYRYLAFNEAHMGRDVRSKQISSLRT